MRRADSSAQHVQLTVRLRIPDLNLQEALRDAVHLLDLAHARTAVRNYGPRHRAWNGAGRTVCARPASRGSSKDVARANGDGVVIAGEEEAEVDGMVQPGPVCSDATFAVFRFVPVLG